MYLLFTGIRYYPLGGWEDFKGTFTTVDLAEAHAREIRGGDGYDWWQIVDIDKGIVKDYWE